MEGGARRAGLQFSPQPKHEHNTKSETEKNDGTKRKPKRLLFSAFLRPRNVFVLPKIYGRLGSGSHE